MIKYIDRPKNLSPMTNSRETEIAFDKGQLQSFKTLFEKTLKWYMNICVFIYVCIYIIYIILYIINLFSFKVSFKYNQYNSAPITLKTAIVLIIHMWTYI